MNLDIEVRAYERETGDKHPVAPKRLWRCKRPFVATKNGRKYLEAQQQWELRFLRWLTETMENKL